MHRRMLFAFVSVAMLLGVPVVGQTIDTQSAAVLTAATVALGRGHPVNDITLTGSATNFNGTTNDSGTATIKIKGADESRVDSAFSAGTQSEVRGLQGATPRGSATVGTQPAQHLPLHNLLTPACWASPASLISAIFRPGSVVSYAGLEQRFGIAVDHLRASYLPPSVHFPSDVAAASFRRLATFDLYLDAGTHLPVSMAFTLHSDRDTAIDFPVEVTYADYRNSFGVLMPYRIKRLIRGRPNLDLTVSSVTVNSGLSDTDFTVQ
jgi:hypothetical protein